MDGPLVPNGWPTGQNAIVFSLATDSAGNVIVGALLSGGSVKFGSLTVDPGKHVASVIVKLSPAGEPLWARKFEADDSYPWDLGVDAAGNVVVAGFFKGSIDFGLGARVSEGSEDMYVVKLAPDGKTLWDHTWGDKDYDAAYSVAVAPDGECIVMGRQVGFVDFGNGVINSNGQVFAVRLDKDGNALWTKGFGAFAGGYNMRARLDLLGNVVLAGSFTGTANFGGAPLTSPQNVSSNADLFLAKLTGSGQHLFSKAFLLKSPGSSQVDGLAIDGAGNIAMSGNTMSPVDFGGGSTQPAGSHSAYLVSFDPTGAFRWQRDLHVQPSGGFSGSLAQSVGTTAAGDVWVTGYSYGGPIDLGAGPVGSPTPTPDPGDTFLARYSATGAYVTGTFYPRSNTNALTMAGGLPVIGGFRSGGANFGTGPLPPDTGLFVAKLDPLARIIHEPPALQPVPPSADRCAVESPPGGGLLTPPRQRRQLRASGAFGPTGAGRRRHRHLGRWLVNPPG